MLNDNILLEERKFGDGKELSMGSSRDGSLAGERRDQDRPGRTRQRKMEERYTRGIFCHLLHRTLLTLVTLESCA